MKLPIKALLVTFAALVSCRVALARPDSEEALVHVIQVATDPALMKSDRDQTLKLVALRGGVQHAHVQGGRAIYDFEEGNETLAHVVFSGDAQGWRLQTITLLFDGIDDEIQLSRLRSALTKVFGEPQDATPGQGSNTTLIWRGNDRLVKVTADVAGVATPLVYAVTVAKQ